MTVEQNMMENSRSTEIPNPPYDQYYRAAGFWIRVLAFLLDLTIIAAFNGIIINSILPAPTQPSVMTRIINPNNLFLGLTGVAYFVLMTRYFQQTLGKMITGIKVIRAGNQPLDWLTVIFREVVGRSLSQMLGLYLGYIFCWFNRDKQCLHDMLCDTWVVHTKPRSDYRSESLRYAAKTA